MAILIPSKNIYEQQNKKVLDNKIDGIEVNGKKATNNTTLQEYFNYSTANSLDVDTDGDWGMHLPKLGGEVSPAENTEYFWTEYKGISTSIYKAWQMFPFEISPKNHFAKNITLENLDKNLVFSITHDWVAGDTNGSFQKNNDLSRQITSNYIFSCQNATMFSTTILEEKPTQDNISNLILELDKQYAGYAYSYVYFEELTNNKIKGYFLFCIGADERYADGTLETAKYAKTSSVSIKMRIGDIEEEDITIKQGDKVNFSIGNNELLQITNKFNDVISKLTQNILNAYSKGKETATLLCSISDYYDYNERSKKIIAIDNSTEKMTFKEHDIVIPMVFGANGEDKPMSLNKDGSPKEFMVLGTKIFYDGAVWQELYLQEA